MSESESPNVSLLPTISVDGPPAIATRSFLHWGDGGRRAANVAHALEHPQVALEVALEVANDRFQSRPRASRSTAIAILEAMGTREAFDALTVLAKRLAPARAELLRAGKSLPPFDDGWPGDPMEAPALREGLTSKNAATRREAAMKLAQLGDDAIVAPLLATLEVLPTAPSSVRGRAPKPVAEAVGAIGALDVLGDVRMIAAVVALSRGGYTGWMARDAKSPEAILRELGPAGLAGLAEIADDLPGAIMVTQGSGNSASDVAERAVMLHRLDRHAATAEGPRRAVVTLLFTKKNESLYDACVARIRALLPRALQAPASAIERELAELCERHDPAKLSPSRSVAWRREGQ